MTIARNNIIVAGEERIYHCISRCVRRAFLCGYDSHTGTNYGYRKKWIEDRLKSLVEIFTIEVLTIAIMDNHLHLLLRTPISKLSYEEIARRWLQLYPKRRNPDDTPCEPNASEIKSLLKRKCYIRKLDKRLKSISWFMKSLNEYIARKANCEDKCTGRFWEGRFKCQRMEDESAVLACSIYIDLNPIRARTAKTPETSRYTGAWYRIHETKEIISSNADDIIHSPIKLRRWLAPLEIVGEQKGYLHMSKAEYLSVLDWTGRQVNEGKIGVIPSQISPIINRIGIKSDRWTDSSFFYGVWFHHIVGNPDNMTTTAASIGKKWFKGISFARQLFSTPWNTAGATSFT